MNSIERRIREQMSKDSKKSTGSSRSEFGVVEMSIPETPKFKEKKNEAWVSIGEDNLYPYAISDLKYGSSIHNAILSSASDMIAGDGFLINDALTPEESKVKEAALNPKQKAEYEIWLKNPNTKINTNKLNKKLAFDLKEQGCFACELIKNVSGDKIATRKYVDVRNLRPGKMVDGEIKSWWYCQDWKKYKYPEYKPKEIAAYDRNNKDDLNQIYFDKIGNFEYYGVPDYIGALTWIQIDFKMGIFHLANVENGMNPSIALKFFQVPSSEEDKAMTISAIKKQYFGANNTGRAMIFFSDGKELAPEVAPIGVSNIDKQMVVIAELCDKKILTGHKLTSPLLAGISTSGQIGGNVELEKSFLIYQNTRIKPMSKILSEFHNEILDYNKTGVKVEINPYKLY